MRYAEAIDYQLKALRFVRTIRPDPSLEQQRDFGREDAIAKSLERAETFYWAPEMIGAVKEVCHSIPLNWAMLMALLPSRDGFFHFADPILIDAGDQGRPTHEMAALAWGVGVDEEDGREAVNVTVFLYEIALDRPALNAITVRAGETIQSVLDRVKSGARGSIGALVGAAFILTFAGCLTFLDQRIMVASKRDLERHARKRLEREKITVEPVVRVIELRRKRSPSHHDGEQTVIDWACQWVVSGHWRQQWYPSLNDYQPRWIMPYVKGPEDKPLKPPRAKVFAVVR